MKPVLASVQDRYAGRVIFLDYKWEREQELRAAADMGVQGHPTYIVVDGNGREVTRLYGYHPEDEVAAALEEALAATE